MPPSYSRVLREGRGAEFEPLQPRKRGPRGGGGSPPPRTAMERTNDEWLKDLRTPGENQAAALSELRKCLRTGLSGALGSRTDAAFHEDVVQEALIRILDRLDAFRGESRFLTWAMTIAVRLAWSEMRRRRWRDVSLEDLNADGRPLRGWQAAPSQENRSMQTALFRRLHELIASRLTEKQRAAVTAELRGMPLEEIAQRTGSNRNAVYKLLHDARRSLKRGLEETGYDGDEVRAVIAR